LQRNSFIRQYVQLVRFHKSYSSSSAMQCNASSKIKISQFLQISTRTAVLLVFMPQLHRFLPRLPIFKSLSVKTNDKGLNTFRLTHMFSSCSTQAHFESSPVKVTFCSHSKSRCTRLPDKNILGEFMESQPSRVSPAGRLLHALLIFTQSSCINLPSHRPT